MADDSKRVLILGSGSPRRRALLGSLGVDFEVCQADVDEAALIDADIVASVKRSAQAKYAAVAASISASVATAQLLTADTLVGHGTSVLGKPTGEADAIATLRALSGATLEISSALCFGEVASDPVVVSVTTVVRLRELSQPEIVEYVATGAAQDKAGALELQGRAHGFMAGFDGCWSNVVGLPLCAVRALMDSAPSTESGPWSCSGADCGRGASV